MLLLLFAQAATVAPTQLPDVHRYATCVLLAAANSSHGEDSPEAIAQASLLKCQDLRDAAAEEAVRVTGEKFHSSTQEDIRRGAQLRMEERGRTVALAAVIELRKIPANSDGKTVYIRKRP